MPEEAQAPQSLLAVTNSTSRALIPSEVYQSEFVEWAHKYGAHLYLVLIGPRIETVALDEDVKCWKLHTRFYDGVQMEPRTIPVPFGILPKGIAQLSHGVVEWVDSSNVSHRWRAVDIVRRVLQQERESGRGFSAWYQSTLREFFTYQVEYIGQSFGQAGERTAAERIAQGHKSVQEILANVADDRPNSAVSFIVLDIHPQSREMTFNVNLSNAEEVAAAMVRFMDEPDGPLDDKRKLVTVAEAMLIRSFPGARNVQYKDFPLKDAPSLVDELIGAGITHLAVQLDVSKSLALLEHPDQSYGPQANLRFAVNLTTGARETLQTTAPLSWQAD